MTASQRMLRAANRLAKWRLILTGWQLGTRAKGDPESDAVRDHREATLMLRAEVSALTRLLVETETVTQERLAVVMTEEYDALSDAIAERFPGATATDHGIQIDPARFAETTRGWLP